MVFLEHKKPRRDPFYDSAKPRVVLGCMLHRRRGKLQKNRKSRRDKRMLTAVGDFDRLFGRPEIQVGRCCLARPMG